MSRRVLSGWVLAASAYAALYGARLNQPPMMYYDEVYQVTTAKQFLALSGYRERAHPPLGMLLMAGSIAVFGDHPWAWRVVSCVAGFASLALVWGIVRMLSTGAWSAGCAAALFGLDGLTVTQARIGMLNATMLAFMLASVWCLVRHVVGGRGSRRTALIFSGVSFGCGLATRWVALSIAAVLVMFVAKLWRSATDRKRLAGELVLWLVLAPLAIYFASFLIVPFLHGYGWSSIWDFQRYMMKLHLDWLQVPHRYESPWWTWPLMLRPIWYGFQRHPMADGRQLVEGVLCIGNPAIIWAIPLALGYMLWRVAMHRSLAMGVSLLGFFTQWGQWAFVKRVTFFHYFFTAMPFAAMALALSLERLWRRGAWGRGVAAAYLAAVVGMFIYWYPLWSALPIPEGYYRHHLWLPSWV